MLKVAVVLLALLFDYFGGSHGINFLCIISRGIFIVAQDNLTNVYYKNEIVGYIVNIKAENQNFYGRWIPAKSSTHAQEFLNSIEHVQKALDNDGEMEDVDVWVSFNLSGPYKVLVTGFEDNVIDLKAYDKAW